MTELGAVRLLGFPVEVYRRSQQHHDALLREFALIVYGAREGMTERAVPERLLALVEDVGRRFAGESAEVQARIAEAESEGDEAVDIAVRLPVGAGASITALAALLDEADAFCLAGEDLLTLVTPPDLRAFREWFFGELAGQLGGGEATPWSGGAGGGSVGSGGSGDDMAEVELPAEPASASAARRFVRTVLAGWEVDELEEAALLLTSELVTNALLHARTPMKLRLRRRPGMVRVEVCDDGRGTPVRRRYDADASTGRGLALVEALAEEWGVEPANGGKAVWFTLPVARAG